MEWSSKRRLLYACAGIVALCGISLFFVRGYIFPSPTCFDGKKNGFEGGIDCGGVCSLVCKEEVRPLSVVWSKAVRGGNGVYDFIGMIRNANINNAATEVGFTFQAYTKEGRPLIAFSGSTTVPLDGSFPVIIQDVHLREAPETVSLTLVEGNHYRVKESPLSPTIRIGATRYEVDSISRVYATIVNAKRLLIRNLPIRVVLLDKDDNAYAVGQTFIEALEKEEAKEVVFTWRGRLPLPPTKIRVYPIFNPFEALSE